MRCIVAGLFLSILLPTAARAQGRPIDLDTFRAQGERLSRDGSWWYASNADFMEADGANAAEAYAVRQWVDPGGLSGGGCLWSIRNGRPEAVHWYFHTMWDMVGGQSVQYQSHTSGQGTGLGSGTTMAGDTTIFEQQFRWADGSGERVQHRSFWPDGDTHVTRSFNYVDGRWEPRRTYTWVRRTGGELPCGPR